MGAERGGEEREKQQRSKKVVPTIHAIIVLSIIVPTKSTSSNQDRYLQEEATGHSPTKLERGKWEQSGKWEPAEWTEKVFFLFFVFSMSMFSSLAEVIEVAIRAEYQVSSVGEVVWGKREF